MSALSLANLKKTLYYLKHNDLRSTWYAIRERLGQEKEAYVFEEISQEEWDAQRRWAAGCDPAAQGSTAQGNTAPSNAAPSNAASFRPVFSIIVPAYRTREAHLKALCDSVLGQSYPHWQLVLADATEDDRVEKVAAEYGDERICYVHLKENGGISRNSNQALSYTKGDFIGLLDHDDVLTSNALYEMALRIAEGRQEGVDIKLLYSDEDKCDSMGESFFEPNYKEKFNLDLILSNNYICHFMMMESNLLKELSFRPEYDGAQDYDLVLRAVERLLPKEEQIAYIPKVLYHWRRHAASTADNPQSKQYAYEAGRKAVQDFADRQGWAAKAVHMKHPGFYGLQYAASPLCDRPDLAAVGGKILKKGKIAGGRWTEEGILLYEGLPAFYSGYLHRAMLAQDADAVDIRCIQVREECREIFEKETGVMYKELPDKPVFDVSLLPEGTDLQKVSMALGKAFRKAGYRILYLPEMSLQLPE